MVALSCVPLKRVFIPCVRATRPTWGMPAAVAAHHVGKDAAARPTWGAPTNKPVVAAAAGGEGAGPEPDSARHAALALGRRVGCRLAFASSPRRPPAFACCLADGTLHVATAQGAELTWDRGGGAPAAELRGHGGLQCSHL